MMTMMMQMTINGDDADDNDDDDADHYDADEDDNDEDDVKVRRICSSPGDYHYYAMMTATMRMREKLNCFLLTPTVKFLKSRSHQSFLT